MIDLRIASQNSTAFSVRSVHITYPPDIGELVRDRADSERDIDLYRSGVHGALRVPYLHALHQIFLLQWILEPVGKKNGRNEPICHLRGRHRRRESGLATSAGAAAGDDGAQPDDNGQTPQEHKEQDDGHPRVEPEQFEWHRGRDEPNSFG
jgi:hypothetical protein